MSFVVNCRDSVNMRIQSLSSAAHRALDGINRSVQQVEQSASDVAAGVGKQPDDDTSQLVASLNKLPELKQQVLSNVQVLETSEELLNQLLNQPQP